MGSANVVNSITNCYNELSVLLSDIPFKWRDAIVKSLCLILAQKNECSNFQNCETVTSLSTFSTSGSVLSVTYTNEDGVSYKRSIDLAPAVNKSLDGIDPKCLMSQSEWNALSHTQRIQALIDSLEDCGCCPTTTTTTSSTTTTTTTVCPDIIDIVAEGNTGEPPTTTTTTSTSTTSTSTSTTTSTSTSTTTSTSTSTSSTSTTSSSTTSTTTVAEGVAYYWYGDTDPYGDLSVGTDTLSYQGTDTFTAGSGIITVTFPPAASTVDGQYLVVRVDAGEPDAATWENVGSLFNYGTIPDANYRELVTQNGYDYYITRVPFFFDGTNYDMQFSV